MNSIKQMFEHVAGKFTAAILLAGLMLVSLACEPQPTTQPVAKDADEPQPTTQPVAKDADEPQPTTQPVAKDTKTTEKKTPDKLGKNVIATVGKREITDEQIARMLKQAGSPIPPDKMDAYRKVACEKLILDRLFVAHAEAKGFKCTDDELAKEKEKMREKLSAQAAAEKMTVDEYIIFIGATDDRIRDNIKVGKMIDDAIEPKKVAEFIKTHPAYFNGSSVQAKHILLMCNETAPTSEQKSTLDKLMGISKEIKAKKITFSEAANKYSKCPSGKKSGGDLGDFVYAGMVPPFSQAAFSAKVGQVTPPVRTQYGFHLIEVVSRKDGKDAPDRRAQDIARASLWANLKNEVLAEALGKFPIVIKD